MNNIVPEVSNWYQDLVTDTLFEVVAIDDDGGTIEVQMLDGEVGEYDIAAWEQLILTHAEPPEDWRSSYELDNADQAYSDQALIPDNFSGVLSDIEPDLLDLGDDFQIL